MSNKNLTFGLVIAIVIALTGWFTPFGQQAATDATQNVGTLFDYFTQDFVVTTQGLWQVNLSPGSLKAPSDTNGIETITRVGSCSTATTTAFAIASPFSSVGTSTVYISLQGTGAANTIDFVIGTTSLSSVSGTSTLTTSKFFGAFSIPATIPFYYSSGNTLSWTPGTYSNSAEVEVGPNDNLVGYATSTGIGANANVLASCTYKAVFYR